MKNKVLLFLLLLISTFGYSQVTLDPVNIGTTANDRTGDPLRTAMQKLNSNDELMNDELARLDGIDDYFRVDATASGTDTYTATPSPVLLSYATNQKYYIKFTNANTGAATLNLNGLGAKAIKKNGTAALVSGDIAAGQILQLDYDGTNLQVVGGGGSSGLPVLGTAGQFLNVNVGGTALQYTTLGSNTQVLYNNGGTITGNAGLTTNGTSITTGGVVLTAPNNGNSIIAKDDASAILFQVGESGGANFIAMNLGSDATGDLLRRNSSGNLQRIPIGSTGDLLTVSGGVPAWSALDADLTAIGALTPTNDDILQRKAGAWTNRTIAQLKTDLSLDLKADLASPTLSGTPLAPTAATSTSSTQIATTAFVKTAAPKYYPVACSDMVSTVTTGTSKAYFRIPHAMTVTAVRASLLTAQSSGTILTIDINESGTTILSTKLTLDNGETTSVTAATPTVISDTALADDAIITFDVDAAGTGGIALIVTLIGY